MLSVGSRDQRVLNRAGDDLRIDWGHFYLAAPRSESATLAASPRAMMDFLHTGALPDDDMEMPRQPRNGAAHLAAALPVEVPSQGTATRHVLVAYDEIHSIEYLGRKLRPEEQLFAGVR